SPSSLFSLQFPPMFIISLLLLLPLSSAELVFVAVIWRHGDRAPGGLPYPLDAHNESAWPRGWNQLTNEGIKETNELGQWLRNRYVVENQHINGVFNKDEVFVRSSDSERALCSAQSVMASLFPPEAEMVWKKGFTWQPVPIHSNGEGRDDPLLKPTSVSCPSYDKLAKEEKQPLLASLNASNQQFFQMLSKNTGMEITAENVDDLYDITREMKHGLKQPDWVTDETLEKIKEQKRLLRTGEFNTQEKARYRGGYLLGDWHSRLNSAASGDKKAKKTLLYSSHDGTVNALMYTMGIANDQLIPYAAAVILELHREKGKDFVQIWYRNDTSSVTSEAIQLELPGCDSSCPLSTFNSITAPLVINTTAQLTEMCTSASSIALPSLMAFLISFVFFT
ncbi:hypothetical protein PFISCL1PPCAC_9779, partial [Pristionchus fissidentatus]